MTPDGNLRSRLPGRFSGSHATFFSPEALVLVRALCILSQIEAFWLGGGSCRHAPRVSIIRFLGKVEKSRAPCLCECCCVRVQRWEESGAVSGR